MKKRLLSLLLAGVMTCLLVLPAAAAAPTNRFSDVSDANLIMSVETLRLMGVLDGYSNGTFRPDTQLTRAQFCKMVICALDAEDELGLYRTVTVYPDVKPSHWAAAYINMAAKGRNVISGYADGKFYPDRTVTMGQAVTILLRVLGYEDKNVGGVWPDSYLAAAASIGLMDGLDMSHGSAPLTRKEAAQLFVNLLRADNSSGEDGKGGGSFLTGLDVTLRDNVMIVSSNAKGPDGKETSLQLSSGEILQMVDDKVSNGCFNGYKGTLVMKGQRVLTFLPNAKGTSRSVILSSAGQLQITDTSGAKYAVAADTSVYYNNKEQKWSEVYTWLNPGTSITLYLGSASNVEFIFVGGGSVSNEAVIVYEKGSAKGFEALTGGAGGYTIVKNGSTAKASDMRPYDVATYSSATNTIRVCDNRLTGYYESCTPNPTEPTSIVVLGHEFPVLTTAQATLSRFRPGDQITLLLTENNQVAGAVKAGTSGAAANVLGLVESVSTSSAKVNLLCGITIEGRVNLSETESGLMQGRLVKVSSEGKGAIGLARLGGGVNGALDLSTRKLGTNSLAETVTVFEYGVEGLKPISFSDLGGGTIPASQISYAHLNWANRVDILVLGGVNNGNVIYGRTSVTMEGSSPDQISYYMTVYNGKDRMGPFRLRSDIPGGTFVMATSDSSGVGFASLRELEKLAAVPNTAWSGQSVVTVNGRSYTVASDVICFNHDTAAWISLDAAHAYAASADLYASDDGVIRAIEVKG